MLTLDIVTQTAVFVWLHLRELAEGSGVGMKINVRRGAGWGIDFACLAISHGGFVADCLLWDFSCFRCGRPLAGIRR